MNGTDPDGTQTVPGSQNLRIEDFARLRETIKKDPGLILDAAMIVGDVLTVPSGEAAAGIALRRGAIDAAERGVIAPASSAVQGARLGEHLRQLEKYGAQGFKELENGRFRYYGNVTPARTPGEMAGARLVREWDPATGNTRIWYETLDHSGNIRSVAPKPPTNPQNHLTFDPDGNYTGRRK